MRQGIDLQIFWGRERRKVLASFDDHSEPRPALPVICPFTLDDLVDPELDVDRVVAGMAAEPPPSCP